MSLELGHAVRLIPLGGLGEFGLNSMLVEYGETRILVDAGMMFPHGNLPGIDSIVPISNLWHQVPPWRESF